MAKPSINYKEAIRSAFNKISTSFQKMQDQAITISRSEGIVRLSYILGWSLGLIAILIPSFKYAMSGDDDQLSDLLHNILIIGIVASITMIPENYALLVKAVSSLFKELSGSILSGTGSSGIFDQMVGVMSGVLNGLFNNIPEGFDIFKNFHFTLMSIGLTFICFICIVIALFFMIIYTNIGNVLMAIAIVLGPVFISCSILKLTRTFFDKWLNFLLIAGMYQVIAAVIMKLISVAPIIPDGAIVKDSIEAASNILAITFSVATLAWVSSLIPDIVNSIMPGQMGGLGGAGGKAFKAGKDAKNKAGDWMKKKMKESDGKGS